MSKEWLCDGISRSLPGGSIVDFDSATTSADAFLAQDWLYSFSSPNNPSQLGVSRSA